MDTTMIVLTAIYVILTGIYAFLTYRIMSANHGAVNAMRDQIVASVRPYVYFDLVSDGPIIEGILKNTGVTAAYDVVVSLKPAIKVDLRGAAKDPCLIGKTISFFAPARQVREFLGSYAELKASNASLTYSGEVTYFDAERRKYSEKFQIDLSSMQDMLYIGRTTVEDELKKLNDKLGDLVSAVSKKS